MVNIIPVDDYDELSDKAAEFILGMVQSSSQVTLGLATGSTPVGIYKRLVHSHKFHNQSYEHVTTFNLDEYIGLRMEDQNSYHYYMNKHLFDHIDIVNHHIPNGLAENLEEEAMNYEVKIAGAGGIDLQVLGIGENGHIGFNEPGTSFQSNTHIVKLAESTRIANSRFFSSLSHVPRYAITMGIGTILKSKKILLLAYGKNKAYALSQYINGAPEIKMPVSALKLHPKVTIIADKAALEA